MHHSFHALHRCSAPSTPFSNRHDAGERLQEHHATGSTGQFEARMYRAQRNTYIAGSLLFCMGVLREFYW